MTRRRGLSPEERELWVKVAATAQPRHPDMPRKVAPAAPKPKKPAPEPIQPFTLGEAARSPATAIQRAMGPAEELATRPIRMDRKAHARLTRGKIAPEGRIDLHGMTLAEAQPALTRFMLRAHARGSRLVLVITGKGKARDEGGPIPSRVGILRHQVPHWLHQPPLAAIVLQVASAHLRHGGEGAYYVYLRRGA